MHRHGLKRANHAALKESRPRRPAEITQADGARVIRAAKQSGANEVVVPVGKRELVVRLAPSIVSKQLEQDDQPNNHAADEWRAASS